MKIKNIFLFAIITLLLVFSGCSENVDIPSTPNNNLIFIQQEGELTPDDYDYVKFEEDCDFDPHNLPEGWLPLPYSHWYLEQILFGIEEGYITFNNENFKKVFTYQLSVAINMIKVGNHEGPTKKIEKVLKKTAINCMIDSVYKNMALALLEAQHFYLKNPNYDYFVPHKKINWSRVITMAAIGAMCVGAACAWYLLH